MSAKTETLLRASKMYLTNDFRFRTRDEEERRWLNAVLRKWACQDILVLAVKSDATSWLCLMLAEEFKRFQPWVPPSQGEEA